MEPRIQYAKTSDGVSIAFWTLGEGQPLVYMGTPPFSHLQLEWQIPALRNEYERLAEKRKVVRYDGRGSGLSDRSVSDYSLDAHVLDLEAVVERLALERFALLANFVGGQVAINYAGRYPERLSHLMLLNTYARRSDYERVPQLQGLLSVLESDFEMYTETLAHLLMGWSAGEQASRLAAYYRECLTPEALKAFIDARTNADVTDLLPQLAVPTLVMQHRQVPLPGLDITRSLASGIPNAQLSVLEGFFMSDPEAQADTILEFLGEEDNEGEPLAAGDVHTILFTDMESSTSLSQQLGDAAAQEVRHAHNEIVRTALSASGGTEIKHTGDGIMASFATASSALDCAIAIQRGVAAHKDEHPDSPLGVYVGLNAGEPIAEDDDLFGTSVDLAARLVDHAQPGQIIASDVVRQLAAGKDFLFADLGETELRGFEDPVKLWELRWKEDD